MSFRSLLSKTGFIRQYCLYKMVQRLFDLPNLFANLFSVSSVCCPGSKGLQRVKSSFQVAEEAHSLAVIASGTITTIQGFNEVVYQLDGRGDISGRPPERHLRAWYST